MYKKRKKIRDENYFSEFNKYYDPRMCELNPEDNYNPLKIYFEDNRGDFISQSEMVEKNLDYLKTITEEQLECFGLNSKDWGWK